ncbi:MAG: photosystem II cytochrome c-550 [Cyanobacteriota bacterium ELA615]
MIKKILWAVMASLVFFFGTGVAPASAVELTEATRTITLDTAGQKTTLSTQQVASGQRLFNLQCTKCHLQGKTKTNNNVSLGLDDLSGAEPARDNLLALVDYLQNPTSYDGVDSLAELHPNTSRPDIFPELKNATKDDLKNLAGYMLIAPRLDERWGGTIYF